MFFKQLGSLFVKGTTKVQKAVFLDGTAHPGHQCAIIVQIMDAVQLVGQYLTALKQVPQIGPRIVAAGIAAAGCIQRALVVLKTSIFYNKSAL